MQIGIVGLGRMGANIARRLVRAGHDIVAWDVNPEAVESVGRDGATTVASLPELVSKLIGPARAVWIMLPHGKITEDTIGKLSDLLEEEDIIIDGGNTYYKDDIRRGAALAALGIRYIDVGTSGGVWGLQRGYCMMVGGNCDTVQYLDPIFSALAPGLGTIERTRGREGRDPRPEQGYIHAGPIGAGHFVKMIHNGIEYGMMQALAEGFDILRNKSSSALPEDQRYNLDLGDIAETWRRGSVVTSWLLDLTASAMAKDDTLAGFSGQVEDSGEGRWSIEAAIEEAIPAEVLTASLFARFRSRAGGTFGAKVLSAMRLGFGGHMESERK